MMCMFRLYRALCLLCCLGPSVCLEPAEHEMSYTDYDNEISQDQEEGNSPLTPCQARELSRWDQLFITLEDSHRRQNMLLDSLERCCGNSASFRKALVQQLAQGTCQQCLPSLEAACRGQAEHASSRLERGLVELREEVVERESRMNATMQQLLQEQAVRLKRLGEEGSMAGLGGPAEVTDSETGPMTQGQKRLGVGCGAGVKPPQPTAKERDEMPAMDTARMERALVAIALELQAAHMKLRRLVEQMG